jgi:hypothetical protein
MVLVVSVWAHRGGALHQHERKVGDESWRRGGPRHAFGPSLGRTAEADAERARLVGISPTSPHTERTLKETIASGQIGVDLSTEAAP